MKELESKDIKKRKSFFGRNWSWIISAAITAVFMLIMMIAMSVAPFGKNSFTLVDSIHQYIPFFSILNDKLHRGADLNYTWNVGMGINFRALYLYYMASPLNIIVYFFSRKNLIAFFSILVALKITISSGAFSFYLSRRRGKPTNNLMIVALGLAYGLNNYMCGYYWNIMWLDCIMVLPLIILGYEQLVKKSDPRLYIAALFYSMYCNYYISFIICIFLVLWFLCSGHKDVKKFFTDGLKFAGCSILAAAMSAFSLVIAYLGIMKTSSAKAPMPEWNWYQNFFAMIRSQFMISKPVNMDTFDGSANLYCGTICLILLFIYIFSERIRPVEKIRKALLVAFLLLSMNQELLNFIWHGFHNQFGIPNRFSFVYIFVLLVISYDMIIQLRKTSYVSIGCGVAASFVVLGLCYKFGDLDGFISDEKLLILSVILISLYTVIIILRRANTVSVKANTIIMGVYLALEILINAAIGIGMNDVADGEYYMQYADEMQAATQKIEEMEEGTGHLFYRQEIYNPIMMDETSFDNIKGVGTFCTTVRGDLVKTASYLGLYTGANEFLYKGATPVTNDLFGVRYVYMRKNAYYAGVSDMENVLSTDNMVVYKNDSALPIGYAIDKDINKWSYANHNCAMVLNHFATYGADISNNIYNTTNPDFTVSGTGCDTEFNPKSPNVINYTNGSGNTMSILVSFIVDDPGKYFINIRGNYMQTVSYSLNGLKKGSDRYQTQLMDLGELVKGDLVTLEIKFSKGCSASGSLTVYTSVLNRDALTAFRAEMTKRGMEVNELKDDYVKGNISLEEDQLVMTSIPYDEGWTAYVDGKEVEIEKLAGAFIGIDAGPGHHDIELKFSPEGTKEGLIVSGLAWLVYIVLFIYIIRQKSRRKAKH